MAERELSSSCSICILSSYIILPSVSIVSVVSCATDDEILYPRSCRKNNKRETKEDISAQDSQSKENKTKALVDNPIKKITKTNKKPGQELTVDEDQEDIEPLVSSQKRKISDEQNCSQKKN